MNIFDTIDDLLGRINLIGEANAFLRFARRGGGVRYYLRRPDKGGRHTMAEVKAHCERYGCDLEGIMNYSSTHFEYTVPLSQRKWHDYLVRHQGNGQVRLVAPRKAWKRK